MIRSPPPRWDTILDRIASDRCQPKAGLQGIPNCADQSAGGANIEQRRLSISLNGDYGILTWRRLAHSGLMLAARISLAHFWVSSIKSFPNSAGDNGMGTFPRPVMRSLTLGSDRPVLISRLSFSIISCGVPRGTATPFQVLAS